MEREARSKRDLQARQERQEQREQQEQGEPERQHHEKEQCKSGKSAERRQMSTKRCQDAPKSDFGAILGSILDPRGGKNLDFRCNCRRKSRFSCFSKGVGKRDPNGSQRRPLGDENGSQEEAPRERQERPRATQERPESRPRGPKKEQLRSPLPFALSGGPWEPPWSDFRAIWEPPGEHFQAIFVPFCYA